MVGTPIAGRAEIREQMKMLDDELPYPAWGRTVQSRFLFFLRCCWRAKTRSWALAANTSRTAS
jgi:hypothetical protein